MATELALAVPGSPRGPMEGHPDDMDMEDMGESEATMALAEAMPKAKEGERSAMKRAIEACVAEFMEKGGEY